MKHSTFCIPKLEEFLKPGTKFTKQELYTVHQSLKEWHIFVQTLQDQTDKSELPTIHRLIDMILQKNTKLMSFLLVKMVRAKKNEEIVLTSEDLTEIERYLVSPKDFYLQIVDEKRNIKGHS